MSDQMEREWAPDRAVTLAALADIDAVQAGAPTCALCGQRAIRLDTYGLCSKTSEQHKDWRAGVRTDRKAGVR
ncbi:MULTISPECIES: hypothetical protein [Bacteria]|uniref:Uncharacterized protein n=1 Tax=Microbacterium phage Min1 TaxID=446529 RepID=A6N1X8_9CAUD|nr:hypothetical protein MPMin1_gp20 [Microbacterium phage Min1]ABR10450.1 hypothetical protein [Microbacterium phage Min1]